MLCYMTRMSAVLSVFTLLAASSVYGTAAAASTVNAASAGTAQAVSAPDGPGATS